MIEDGEFGGGILAHFTIQKQCSAMLNSDRDQSLELSENNLFSFRLTSSSIGSAVSC